MSDKTNEDLREHLFATLAALRDEEKPMDIERAKAIVDVAQVIINSAKVEVDFLRITNGDESKFLGKPNDVPQLPDGVSNVVRHRIR